MDEIKKGNYQIDEENAVKAFLRFRSYPTDKQAIAIAFLDGMEFQKSISEDGKPGQGFPARLKE